jgi:WD40 repeat protein
MYSVPVTIGVRGAGHPTGLAVSSDFVVSGWEDGRLRCHDAEAAEELWKIEDAHASGVTSLLMSNNSRFVVSGGGLGDVRVWELRSRELVMHLKEHSGPVTSLAMYDDDVHVLSCSRDKSFLCWDLRKEKRISSHTQRMGAINDIAISRDQSLVFTVGQERKLTYWDLREPHPVQVIDAPHGEAEATCIAVANNMDIVATGGADQSVRVWDIRSSRLLSEGVGHSGPLRDLSFSPDDRQLMTVGDDSCIFVWNMYT